MKTSARILGTFVIGALIVGGLRATLQRQKDLCLASAALATSPTSSKAGGKTTLVITLQMKDEYHIYDANPGQAGLIPTTFKGTAVPGITYGKPVFPNPKLDNGTRVHGGKVIIKVPVTIAKTIKKGKLNIGGEIHLQACNASGCLPPFTLKLSSPLQVK